MTSHHRLNLRPDWFRWSWTVSASALYGPPGNIPGQGSSFVEPEHRVDETGRS